MNFLRKMINRDYDIKLDMPYAEFGKHPVYTNMDVRKEPKDVFVIKFNDCRKVYAVSDKYRPCSECPMRIKDMVKSGLFCGLKYRVGYNTTVGVCTHVGFMKGIQHCGLIDMDTILEDL